MSKGCLDPNEKRRHKNGSNAGTRSTIKRRVKGGAKREENTEQSYTAIKDSFQESLSPAWRSTSDSICNWTEKLSGIQYFSVVDRLGCSRSVWRALQHKPA